MKTRTLKKALSLFLSLVMMLSLLPTMALADAPEAAGNVAITSKGDFDAAFKPGAAIEAFDGDKASEYFTVEDENGEKMKVHINIFDLSTDKNPVTSGKLTFHKYRVDLMFTAPEGKYFRLHADSLAIDKNSIVDGSYLNDKFVSDFACSSIEPINPAPAFGVLPLTAEIEPPYAYDPKNFSANKYGYITFEYDFSYTATVIGEDGFAEVQTFSSENDNDNVLQDAVDYAKNNNLETIEIEGVCADEITVSSPLTIKWYNNGGESSSKKVSSYSEDHVTYDGENYTLVYNSNDSGNYSTITIAEIQSNYTVCYEKNQWAYDPGPYEDTGSNDYNALQEAINARNEDWEGEGPITIDGKCYHSAVLKGEVELTWDEDTTFNAEKLLKSGETGKVVVVVHNGNTYTASLQSAPFEIFRGGISVGSYANINAAVSAAESGDTIQVANTISGSLSFTLPEGVTFDANGMIAADKLDLTPCAGSKIVHSGNLYFNVSNDAAAMIGTTVYTTLQAAVDAAEDGETVELLSDLELTETVDLPDVIFTLDLGGHTVWAKGAANGTFSIMEGDVTIKNGTVKLNGPSVQGGAIYLGWSGAKLHLVDATVEAFGNTCPILAMVGATVDITNSTLIENGEDACIHATEISSMGTTKVTVNSGTFVANGDTSGFAWAEGGTVEIKGGMFSVGEDNTEPHPFFDVSNGSNWGYKGTVTVTGGYYDFDPSDYVADGYEAVELTSGAEFDAGYTYKVQEKAVTYVAQIGEGDDAVKYPTLAEAVAAAKDGDTITLIANETVTFTDTAFYATINNGRTITLDLNGYAVDATSTKMGYTGLIFVDNGSKLIVKDSGNNGALKYTDQTDNQGGATIRVWGCLDVEGGLIENKTSCVSSAIQAAVDVYANEWGVEYNPKELVFNMKGGTFKSNNDNTIRLSNFSAKNLANPTSVTVNVTGGKVIGGADAFFIQGASNNDFGINTLNISGGEFDCTQPVRIFCSLAQNYEGANKPVNVNISGGYFKQNNSKKTFWNGVAVQNNGGDSSIIETWANVSVTGGFFNYEVKDAASTYECVPNDDTATKDTYPWTIGVAATPVCKIGEVKYASLADAIAAVPTDGTETTITMIADETFAENTGVTIPKTKNIILDLNGCVIGNNITVEKASATITNNGILTIRDTSEGQTGIVTNAATEKATGNWWSDPQKNWTTNTITNYGTLTLESGTIQNNATGISYCVDNNSNGVDATFNMNGGKIEDKGCALRFFCNSKDNENNFNMTAGTIESKESQAFWVQLPGSSSQAKKFNMTISGGTISGATTQAYSWYDYSFGDVFDNVTYSITGGYFTGGIFSYEKTGFITGGYYDKCEYVDGDDTWNLSDYVATGYQVIPNTDVATKDAYPYTIGVKATPVAQIGTQGYETLAGAIAAAKDGDKIELLANIELTETVSVAKQITLDLGTYNITPVAGGLTANSRGTTDALIAVNYGGDLTITGTAGKISSNGIASVYAAVKMTEKGETAGEEPARLTVNGGMLEGYYYGITGNGNRHNTEVTVSGGTVKGTNGDDCVGIYNPQNGSLTIKGGTVEGAVGVYVKAGTVAVVDGGTVIGNGNEHDYAYNGSGADCTGDAFVVDCAGYPGGTPNVTISGGRFKSTNNDAVASYAKTGETAVTGFITGGYYSNDVDETYVASTHECVALSGDNTTDAGYDENYADLIAAGYGWKVVARTSGVKVTVDSGDTGEFYYGDDLNAAIEAAKEKAAEQAAVSEKPVVATVTVTENKDDGITATIDDTVKIVAPTNNANNVTADLGYKLLTEGEDGTTTTYTAEALDIGKKADETPGNGVKKTASEEVAATIAENATVAEQDAKIVKTVTDTTIAKLVEETKTKNNVTLLEELLEKNNVNQGTAVKALNANATTAGQKITNADAAANVTVKVVTSYETKIKNADATKGTFTVDIKPQYDIFAYATEDATNGVRMTKESVSLTDVEYNALLKDPTTPSGYKTVTMYIKVDGATEHNYKVGEPLVVKHTTESGDVKYYDAVIIRATDEQPDLVKDALYAKFNNTDGFSEFELYPILLKDDKEAANYMSLNLEGNIGINFYLDLNAYTDWATVEVTRNPTLLKYGGSAITETYKKNGSGKPEFESSTGNEGDRSFVKHIEDGDTSYDSNYRGKYLFKDTATSTQMNDKVTVTIKDSTGVVLKQLSYSVADYCKLLRKDNSGKGLETNKALADALLNYGAYAQINFNQDTGNLPNAGLGIEIDFDEFDNKELDALKTSCGGTSGTPSGQNGYMGATTICRDITTLRLYFADSFEADSSYSMGGSTIDTDKYFQPSVVPVKYDAGKKVWAYVDISNIPAAEMNLVVTYNANGVTVSKSVLQYAYGVINNQSGDAKLQNFMKALYLYHVAAKNYFNNK